MGVQLLKPHIKKHLMIKKLVLLFLLTTSLSNSQELMNYYLEPNTTNDVIDLHTLVYNNKASYFINYSISIIDNDITIALCYINTSSQSNTFDSRIFNIDLPEGYNSYSITIELFGDNDGEPCTNNSLVDIGTLAFNSPYNPIATSGIPDDVFEDYLEDLGFGDDIENNDIVFNHRIINLRNLFMSIGTGEHIFSLEGLDEFINLKDLRCMGNSITEIDVSTHILLETLSCSSNPINELDVSNNPNLISLQCSGTNITNLDVTNNVELAFLDMRGNNITDINLGQNINLGSLDFSYCQISLIDLSNNILMWRLYCSHNLLTSLDVSNNIDLWELSCHNNLLTSINLGEISNLNFIMAANNLITSLDLSNNSQLKSIRVFSNNLASLNLKNNNNANITTLSAGFNDNLYCIDVDNENEAPYPGWHVEPQVVFSEDCTLGIEDKLTTQITLYPNPVKDLLKIDNIGSYEITSIKLYDLLGKLVLVEGNDFNQLDLSNLNSGLFFVEIETELGVLTKKVIKE